MSQRIVEEIDPQKSYTVREFCRRIGVSSGTYRELRKLGLRVAGIHQKRWIFGADWHAFLRQQQAAESQAEVEHA